MRSSDNLFGAMHYLQTTFRNNEKTVYGIIGGRLEKFIMSVALASTAQYCEKELILNGC